jgi:uncharacterized protein YlxW (UPF0749 family)
MVIIDKKIHKDIHTEQHYFIFDNNTDLQVPPKEWNEYKVGDIYPNTNLSVQTSVTTIDGECNWEEMYNNQQKHITKSSKEICELKDKLNEITKEYNTLQEQINKINQNLKLQDEPKDAI